MNTKLAISLFDQGLADFERSVLAAVRVSEANMGINHTGRQNHALFLFAKLLAHDLSLLAIVNGYRNSPAGSALLDHFSVASITRTMMDASLITMYITHLSLTRDEWNLRRYIFYLHDICNRKRFLKSTDGSEDESDFKTARTNFFIKIKHFSDQLRITQDA